MSNTHQTVYDNLLTSLSEAAHVFGSKHRLVQYLREYYYEINTAGDLLVNEMIDIFEATREPVASMFAIQYPDADLVELCARHIVEDALGEKLMPTKSD